MKTHMEEEDIEGDLSKDLCPPTTEDVCTPVSDTDCPSAVSAGEESPSATSTTTCSPETVVATCTQCGDRFTQAVRVKEETGNPVICRPCADQFKALFNLDV